LYIDEPPLVIFNYGINSTAGKDEGRRIYSYFSIISEFLQNFNILFRNFSKLLEKKNPCTTIVQEWLSKELFCAS